MDDRTIEDMACFIVTGHIDEDSPVLEQVHQAFLERHMRVGFSRSISEAQWEQSRSLVTQDRPRELSDEEAAPQTLALALAVVAMIFVGQDLDKFKPTGPSGVLIRLANYLHEHPEEDEQLQDCIGGVYPRELL